MKPITDKLSTLLSQVQSALKQLALDEERAALAVLDERAAAPDFWSDSDEAQRVSREAAQLRDYIDGWQKLEEDLKTTLELAQMSDESQLSEFEGQIKDLAKRTEAA